MNIKIINTQRVLSPTQINLADYVINPYRGCEFGCLYCYSQENKNIEKNLFAESMGVKINAPGILEKELKYKKPRRVLLGSTTECFQYQESKYKITREILCILNTYEIPYTILTKSPFITNYLDLISENNKNKIYFTYNFVSSGISKLLEQNSPSMESRLGAIKKIAGCGIDLRVHIGPFIPYISCLSCLEENQDSEKIESILNKLPENIKEIDIELYHKKQGNFKKILDLIKSNISVKTSQRLTQIYENEKNYKIYTEKLKEKIKSLAGIYPFEIYYIIPDFDKFYTPYINYETPVF